MLMLGLIDIDVIDQLTMAISVLWCGWLRKKERRLAFVGMMRFADHSVFFVLIRSSLG